MGLVAGSDNDINNLSIAITARELNPDLFIVMRQSSSANSLLFEAFDADLTMITTQTVAHACLSYLTTPMLARFIREVEKQSPDWAASIMAELTPICAGRVPYVWTTRINRVKTPALAAQLLHTHNVINLSVLMTSNRNREESLKLLPLMLERAGQLIIRPDPSLPLHTGDKIIWTGHREAWNEQKLTASYSNALDYVLTGTSHTGSWLGKYLNS